jgi:hypothetical protein
MMKLYFYSRIALISIIIVLSILITAFCCRVESDIMNGVISADQLTAKLVTIVNDSSIIER